MLLIDMNMVREYPRPELLSMDAGEQTSVPREQGSQAGDPGPAARLNGNNLGDDFSFLPIHSCLMIPGLGAPLFTQDEKSIPYQLKVRYGTPIPMSAIYVRY